MSLVAIAWSKKLNSAQHTSHPRLSLWVQCQSSHFCSEGQRRRSHLEELHTGTRKSSPDWFPPYVKWTPPSNSTTTLYSHLPRTIKISKDIFDLNLGKGVGLELERFSYLVLHHSWRNTRAQIKPELFSIRAT